MIGKWREQGLLPLAASSIEWDNAFLVAYGAFLALASTRRALRSKALWRVAGFVAAGCAVTASTFDAIENHAMLEMLRGAPSDTLAPPSRAAATAKFALVALSAIYVLVGLFFGRREEVAEHKYDETPDPGGSARKTARVAGAAPGGFPGWCIAGLLSGFAIASSMHLAGARGETRRRPAEAPPAQIFGRHAQLGCGIESRSPQSDLLGRSECRLLRSGFRPSNVLRDLHALTSSKSTHTVRRDRCRCLFPRFAAAGPRSSPAFRRGAPDRGIAVGLDG